MIEVEKVSLFRVKKDDQVIHLTEEEARELFAQLSQLFPSDPIPWTVTYTEGQGATPTASRQHP